VRSAGITDLRHGNVLQADWHDVGRFERAPDAREPLPLPEGVACFTVAASTSSEPAGGVGSIRSRLADALWGDGLVPVHSALGLHADGARSLVFPQERQYIAWQTDHMALLTSADVQRRLRLWLSGASQQLSK
jgi:hypothetical protein